jgi:hypothetical protein
LHLAASGLLDYLSVSGGAGMTPWAQAAVVPGHWWPQGCYAGYAKAMREITGGLPILYAGRVVRPEMAERLLADGACDLVAMTRAILADPELPSKAREGRLDEIRHCVGANVCIGRRYGHYQPVACIYNPSAGGQRWSGTRAPAWIVVVGGGPRTSRVAPRGIRCTLRGRRDLGGMLLERPSRTGTSCRDPRLLSPRSRLGVARLRPRHLIAGTPDAVSGDRLLGLPSRSAGDPGDVSRTLRARPGVRRERYRGGPLLLAQRRVVEIDARPPRGMRRSSNLVPFYRHLFEAGVGFAPNHELRAATGRAIRLRNVFTGAEVEREPVDAVVAALLRRIPQDDLYHELRTTGETHLVGDASAARPTEKVILEAAVLARRL